MSPRTADPDIRDALVQTAARILATDGPSRLTLRHLTNEVGTSTMAVYTHFGSMDDLRVEVCNEGFRRLAAHLGRVERTADPVADLAALGRAYVANARENPNLYRAMFLDRLPGVAPRPETDDPSQGAAVPDEPEWLATFEALVRGVERCIDSGAFVDADPVHLATELWATTHGAVSLELNGLLEPARSAATLADLSTRLLSSYRSGPPTQTD